MAASRLNIDVAVSYYGMGLNEHLDEARAVRCPIVLRFAAADGFTPPAVREAVRKALAGRDDAEIYVYSEAGHGFNNSSRESYNRSAAALATFRAPSEFCAEPSGRVMTWMRYGKSTWSTSSPLAAPRQRCGPWSLSRT